MSERGFTETLAIARKCGTVSAMSAPLNLADPACAGALPQPPELVVPVRVLYFDTDAAGVMHNVAYLRLIEVARIALSEHLGWMLADMRDSGLVPVVARTQIDYLKPARLGDQLEIHARLARLEKVRFHLEFEMTRPADGALIARCAQTMVTVQLPAGRPQPVPAAWREAYAHSIAK